MTSIPSSLVSGKHTSPPWMVRDNENGTLEINAKEPDGTDCQVAQINIEAVDEVYGPITWANAHLIAAAPDLLATCEALMPWAAKAVADHYNQLIGERTLRRAEVVITKATCPESWTFPAES